MDESERYRRGMSVRRAVLGDDHVDRASREQTGLTEEFQELITRYAWGEIWNRPGLPRSTRSLVTLAMMVALNRSEELRLHLRAAARCGVSPAQIKEVLLHAAVYCGVPAANAAFHAAAEVLAEAPAKRDRPKARRSRRPARRR
jgi:4-carboxymuconolactone decarboxylase